MEELDKKFDLPDAEENEKTSEISTKLEKNMKEIQKYINWKKNNSIIQIRQWNYNPRYLYYR